MSIVNRWLEWVIYVIAHGYDVYGKWNDKILADGTIVERLVGT